MLKFVVHSVNVHTLCIRVIKRFERVRNIFVEKPFKIRIQILCVNCI